MAALKGLVVRIRQRTICALKPITDANAWMIGQFSLHIDCANLKSHLFEFFYENIARQPFEFDWEIGAFHLLGEDTGQALFCSFVAEELNLVLRIVGRLKKGKALNVIPMGVSNEDGKMKRLAIEL